MNSGRISMFSAKEEYFLTTAKDALIESFNQKGMVMSVNFSECVVNGSAFGENAKVINEGEHNETTK